MKYNHSDNVIYSQGGQAIQLIGSQRPRLNNMPRQVQSNQVKSAVLSNQLVTVAKTVTASQLILSGNKQILAPIMGKSKDFISNKIYNKSTHTYSAKRGTRSLWHFLALISRQYV